MFIYDEPEVKPWILSKFKTDEYIISKEILHFLKKPDIIALNFLIQNHKNKFKGCILNEESGFYSQTQVSAFLRISFDQIVNQKEPFRVLVLTPGYLLERWNRKLKEVGKFQVLIVNPDTRPVEFEDESVIVLLVSFDDIKLSDALSEYKYSFIIIDHFDGIATKQVVRKLSGEFNIGLTQRNFYVNPNQKLQWTMLNWANPGCVGRLLDFYKVDNDHFTSMRDNYHHWWFMLTWDFSEDFIKPSDTEEESVIEEFVSQKRSIRIRETNKQKRNIRKSETNKHKKSKTHHSNSGENVSQSQEDKDISVTTRESVIKIQMDETKISPTEENVKIEVKTDSQNTIEYTLSQEYPTASKGDDDNDDSDNFLLNIIQGVRKESSSPIDYQTQVKLKKEELYSQILNDDDEDDHFDIPHSQSQDSNSSDDYLLSLIK